jgi:hypothetical protein
LDWGHGLGSWYTPSGSFCNRAHCWRAFGFSNRFEYSLPQVRAAPSDERCDGWGQIAFLELGRLASLLIEG